MKPKPERLWFNRNNPFGSAMMKPKFRVFNSVMTTSLIWPWWMWVREAWIRLQWPLWFGLSDAESKSLRLARDDLSSSAMTKASRRVFNSVAIPLRFSYDEVEVGESSTWLHRPLRFGYDERESEGLWISRGESLRFSHNNLVNLFKLAAMISLIWLRWSRSIRIFNLLWRLHRFVDDEGESKILWFSRGDLYDLAVMKLKLESFDTARTTSPIQPWQRRVGEVLIWPRDPFDLAAMTSSTWLWWCRVEDSLTHPRRPRRFGHEKDLLESLWLGCDDLSGLAMMKSKFENLWLGRGDLSDLAMTKLSRKVFNWASTKPK